MNPAEQEAGLGIVGIALQSIFQLDPGSRQVALLEKLLRALEKAGGVNGGRGPKRKPCQRQKGQKTGQPAPPASLAPCCAVAGPGPRRSQISTDPRAAHQPLLLPPRIWPITNHPLPPHSSHTQHTTHSTP